MEEPLQKTMQISKKIPFHFCAISALLKNNYSTSFCLTTFSRNLCAAWLCLHSWCFSTKASKSRRRAFTCCKQKSKHTFLCHLYPKTLVQKKVGNLEKYSQKIIWKYLKKILKVCWQSWGSNDSHHSNIPIHPVTLISMVLGYLLPTHC